jgi:hypothetical protein
LISTTQLSGVSWGPPELNLFGPLWHVKAAANLRGHTLVFQGRFDLPLLSAASYSQHAAVLASGGQLDGALVDARVGVAISPDRMQGHLRLAQILAKRKELPEARAEYREAIRLAELGELGYYRSSLATARRELNALDSLR